MPKFILTYHQPIAYVPAFDEKTAAAWGSFFDAMGGSIVEPGQPVVDRAAIGETGSSTKLGGYSVVEADDLDAALAIAKGCPTLTYGGGVQVGVLAELPPDHPASRLRQRAAQA